MYSFENQEKLTPDSVSGRVENLQKIETSGLELFEQQCINIFTFKAGLAILDIRKKWEGCNRDSFLNA